MPQVTSVHADPPQHIPDALLRMRWEQLAYLHWDVEPDEVARLLPEGLEPEVIEGRSWVGLVPFRLAGIRLVAPGTRSVVLPWSTFPETNVRTYVIGPDGRAERREVRLGRPVLDQEDRAWHPVLGGLAAGERLVTDNLEMLADGAELMVLED